MCPLIHSFFSMAFAQDLCTLFCVPCLCFMFCVLSLASDCDLDQNMHSYCVATTKLHRKGTGLEEKFSFSSVRIQGKSVKSPSSPLLCFLPDNNYRK